MRPSLPPKAPTSPVTPQGVADLPAAAAPGAPADLAAALGAANRSAVAAPPAPAAPAEALPEVPAAAGSLASAPDASSPAPGGAPALRDAPSVGEPAAAPATAAASAVPAAVAAEATAASVATTTTRIRRSKTRTSTTTTTSVEVGEGAVLLALSPSSGPRDGGTRVVLTCMGLEGVDDSISVMLTGVQTGTMASAVEAERLNVDKLAFVMPDLTLHKGPRVGAGVLVFLTVTVKKQVTPGPRGKKKTVTNTIAGPLFYRLLAPLSMLAPTWITPCCEFKTSGGEVMTLSGNQVKHAPSHHALVRFRGQEHEQEVDGQVVQGDWGVAEVAEEALRADAWHIFAVTPPWPHSEEDVAVEISWNRQQFTISPRTVRFVESSSLFGEIAEMVSEEHLQSPVASGASRGSGRMGELSEVAGPGSDGRTETMTIMAESEGQTLGLVDREGNNFILARSKDLSHLVEDLRIIHDLFLLTVAAFGGGVLASRLEVPSIIGYLIGGIVVGPGCLDLVVELVQVI